MEPSTTPAHSTQAKAPPKPYAHSETLIATPVATPPATPTPAAVAAHKLHSEIRAIYHDLRHLSSLAPCDVVNTRLTRLVELCIAPHTPDTVDHFARIDGVHSLSHALQSICAAAEGELETYWANRIVDSTATTSRTVVHPTNNSPLQTFPYHANYTSLTHLEATLLTAFLPHPHTPPRALAFIGSGPLPLTSFCLHAIWPTARIHNIDRDAAAVSLSSRLAQTLGFVDDARMTFACEEVGKDADDDETDWMGFDVVYLAALVGMASREKIGVLAGLAGRLRGGTLVVCRSARGLRGVLYPVLELGEELQSVGMEVLAEVHPWTSVVNSVVVLRVLERS